MTHEEALNRILAQACPNNIAEEDAAIRTYYIELHCTALSIRARSLGNLSYEILSVEKAISRPMCTECGSTEEHSLSCSHFRQ